MERLKPRGSYDLAVIRQIVKSGHNVIDRVSEVLVPGAMEQFALGNPGSEEARDVARRLLDSLHAGGQLPEWKGEGASDGPDA